MLICQNCWLNIKTSKIHIFKFLGLNFEQKQKSQKKIAVAALNNLNQHN